MASLCCDTDSCTRIKKPQLKYLSPCFLYCTRLAGKKKPNKHKTRGPWATLLTWKKTQLKSINTCILLYHKVD